MLKKDSRIIGEELKRAKKKRNYALIKRQNFECSICRTTLDGGKSTHWDHNHRTGAYRAMLCHHCNCGLGFFKDNPLLLHKAALYLELHGGF